MSCAKHCTGHWEYGNGHNVALCPEEAGTGAGTKANDAYGEEQSALADCTKCRGAGDWGGGGGHLPQPARSKGLGGCTERHTSRMNR